ncbi:uncharacterized protein LOC115263362 [Aedes albopictus]|uniref:Secreted protein n=1 Tax=Aedes albopictus TaxID=7160 RepID=A0ABM1XVF2_AEDAL
MIKVISLLVVVAVAAASAHPMKTGPSPAAALPLPQLIHTSSNAPEEATLAAQAQDDQITTVAPTEGGSSDDMAKAETFGFGFHKHIYVAPQYYGGYYGGYAGGYYPYYPQYYSSYDYGYPYYY